MRQQILAALQKSADAMGINAISHLLDQPVPRRTLQRHLRGLAAERRVEVIGKGRAIRYRIPAAFGDQTEGLQRAADTRAYETFLPLSEEAREILRYVRLPLAARRPVGYDRGLLDAYAPGSTWYLDQATRSHLRALGATADGERPAGTYGRAILDRLLIDLSWASSRLEGNTYTRLDTRRLIEAGQAAHGKDAQETQMILNHKRAIELLVEEAEYVDFDRYTILNLHGLLSENLLPDPTASGRLRTRAVQIGNSVYHPNNVPQQIEECFDRLLLRARAIDDPYEQSFFAMVHIPYLQPFEDVNKRVARLAANIPMLKRNLCPLTFLDLPDRAYVDAMLGLYETGRFDLLKDLYVWAYERSTQQYLEAKRSLADPDPIRLKYREQVYAIVGEVVLGLRSPARPIVLEYAEQHVDEGDRERFVAIAMEDLKRLHEGVIARYRIRPSELEAWNAGLEKQTNPRGD